MPPVESSFDKDKNTPSSHVFKIKAFDVLVATTMPMNLKTLDSVVVLQGLCKNMNPLCIDTVNQSAMSLNQLEFDQRTKHWDLILKPNGSLMQNGVPQIP